MTTAPSSIIHFTQSDQNYYFSRSIIISDRSAHNKRHTRENAQRTNNMKNIFHFFNLVRHAPDPHNTSCKTFVLDLWLSEIFFPVKMFPIAEKPDNSLSLVNIPFSFTKYFLLYFPTRQQNSLTQVIINLSTCLDARILLSSLISPALVFPFQFIELHNCAGHL